MIHVCFGLYDKDGLYSKFTATTISSMFENTKSKVTVHILHDDTLTQDNRDKFNYLAGQYNRQIKFYNVEKICANKIESIRQMMSDASMFDRFTVGAVYRLLVTDVLPNNIDKLFYFDSDIIFNLDIKEMDDIDLKGKPLAAVAEFDLGIKTESMYLAHKLVTSGMLSYKEYFSSAVLIINLDYWRKNQKLIDEGLNFIARNTDCNYFDQDVLNYCFGKNYLHLPEHYNCWIPFERRVNPEIKKAVYHYVSQSLKLDKRDNFNKLWFENFSKTPWFNIDALLNIGDGVRELYNAIKDTALRLSILMTMKRRAFFMTPANVAGVTKIFNINENDEVITATDNDAFKNMVLSLRESEGKKFFYIFVPSFGHISEALAKNGFVKDIDYIDGMSILSEKYGLIPDTFSVVKSM